MADLIDRIELMRQIAEFGREIPKDQVIGVIARQEAVEVEALKQVTSKLNNPDDSLLTDDSEACKEQKSKLDLISRAEAIEHFMRLSEDESLTPYTQMLMIGVSNEIKKLPSADRTKGEWKCMADCGVTECDQCGWSIEEYVGDYNFCPNCGSDNRERSE